MLERRIDMRRLQLDEIPDICIYFVISTSKEVISCLHLVFNKTLSSNKKYLKITGIEGRGGRKEEEVEAIGIEGIESIY